MNWLRGLLAVEHSGPARKAIRKMTGFLLCERFDSVDIQKLASRFFKNHKDKDKIITADCVLRMKEAVLTDFLPRFIFPRIILVVSLYST